MELNFVIDKKIQPSNLFIEVLKPLKIKDSDAFEYIGRVRPPRTPMKYKRPGFNPYARPLVNPDLLPFLCSYAPEFLDGKVLKTKYMLTSKYPRAEYVSTSKYANDYELPHIEEWEMAKIMTAQAYSCLDNSPPMTASAGISWLERKTSPGMPWSYVHQFKDTIIDASWSLPWYLAWERSILRGEAGPFYWRSFIKDEIKKISDVKDDNPRTIMACPWQASVLGNRLFGPMNEKLTAAGGTFRTPCFVGVKKWNRFWTHLVLHLKKFPNRAHGDCTRFDGSVSPAPFEFIRSFRLSCIGNNVVNQKLVDYYYENVIKSFIIGWEGDVFMKKMGQPSGQTNTLSDNSIIHTLYWFYHWCSHVCKDPRFQPTWQSFRDHVHLVIMGDDVIYSWSNEVGDLMSPKAVIATFATLKVTLKCEQDLTEHLEHSEFCSMTFAKHGQDYVPVMKREKMLASIFLPCSQNPRLALRRLLAIRIEVFWDKWLFGLTNSLVDWMLREYTPVMSRKITNQDGDDATLEEILTLRWTNYEIEKHYLEV